jgi:putative peptide zinc metalloprotease protein
MIPRLRRRATLLLACAALLAGMGAAEQPASAAQSSAVAVNTKDGSSLFRLSFSLLRANGEVVDPVNAAVAFASCESCQTVAIAIQAVLVVSEPSVVAPVNLALAVNQNCTSCQTLASAYQFILGTGGRVRLTSEGRRRIAEVRRQLRGLGDSGLSIYQIQSRTDELAADVSQVLRTELIAVGVPSDRSNGSGAGTRPPSDDGGPPPEAQEPDASDSPASDEPPQEQDETGTPPSDASAEQPDTTTAPDDGGSPETTGGSAEEGDGTPAEPSPTSP